MVLAHGGTAGLVVELTVLAGLIAVAVVIWLIQRDLDDEDGEGGLPDDRPTTEG